MKPAGLLLVDKPEGPTSHDMIAIVRRAMGIRPVGHTGTLDPFASGLLLLCVGWATRLAEYLVPLPKLYRGIIRLGERTDTDDLTGTVVARSDDWRGLGPDQVQRALDDQVGEIEQLPPAYSAKKLSGRRAYAVARAGGTPDLRTQRVTIRRLSLCEMSLPDLTVEIECSSGTYVRSLARDLGASLGVGGHVIGLRRLRVGEFEVEDALELDRETPADLVCQRLRPPETAVTHLERVELDDEDASSFSHGRPVALEAGEPQGPMAVFAAGALLAIGECRDGSLWPKKVFASAIQ